MSPEEEEAIPVDLEEAEEKGTTVAVIEKKGVVDLGFSPQFPDSLVLYFKEGPHALVFRDEAASRLLLQMRGMLIMCGLVEEVDPEELEEGFRIPPKKVTLH